MKTVEIISERVFKAGYILRREIVDTPDPDNPPIEWTMAYTPSGDYIGDPKMAHRLCVKRGIRPEKNKPEHSTCSIGFSAKNGKWYGWSHRAIYGFKIGSTCKPGDCHYQPRNRREEQRESAKFYGGTVTKRDATGFSIKAGELCIRCDYPKEFGKGEWTAETVADAKQMACDFVESVS